MKVWIQAIDVPNFVMRFSWFRQVDDCRCDGYCFQGQMPDHRFMATVRDLCTEPPVFELPVSKALTH